MATFEHALPSLDTPANNEHNEKNLRKISDNTYECLKVSSHEYLSLVDKYTKGTIPLQSVERDTHDKVLSDSDNGCFSPFELYAISKSYKLPENNTLFEQVNKLDEVATRRNKQVHIALHVRYNHTYHIPYIECLYAIKNFCIFYLYMYIYKILITLLCKSFLLSLLYADSEIYKYCVKVQACIFHIM